MTFLNGNFSFKSPQSFQFEKASWTLDWLSSGRSLNIVHLGEQKRGFGNPKASIASCLTFFFTHFFSLLPSKIKMSEIISFSLVIIEMFTFFITVNFLKLVSLAFLEEYFLKKERKKAFTKKKECAWSLNAGVIMGCHWHQFVLSRLHFCFLGSSLNIVAPGN